MTSYRALFDLSGKVAIVTGGAGILGTRFCTGLAEFGADVVVADIDAGKGAELAARLASAHQVRAAFVPCDVADPASVSEMVKRVVTDFGGIHVLHNNAGGKSKDLEKYFAPIESYSLEQWRESMAVNLDGMFLVAKEVGGQMIRQGGGGSIVQTASIYGVVAPDQRIYEGSSYLGRAINTPAVYSTSKAGVVGLTRHLATAWAHHRIRVNTLTPGGVQSGQNEEFKRRYSARIPLGRMAEGEEMVGALVYLASDASSYVTGHNLMVDGGLSAW